MNRTERLYAIREELRRAGPGGRTGGRLAALLEVSPRTIKRDIAALQQAGAPVWAQAGPGGGYVLAASASLPPVNFSPGQAVAVAVALAALAPGSPFAVDGAVARGKVFDALAPPDRARAHDVAGRVWFAGTGPVGGSGPTSGPGPSLRPSPSVLRVAEQSLFRGLVVALRYRDRSGVVTNRTVEPVLLARTEQGWYLVAWCRDRLAVRWFRLDRIERADLTREPYEPRPVADVGTPPADSAPALSRP
ncbi:helix-turn-helix transcriptional regulator [Pengzhenrongella sicca]|uniref:WYL domain-containing protein n=1 Tax=Pengzhenrongella sicca TaxID=2819238 RepID=A0A8A4ZDN9_9MICO|nr:WYL domain-containing protein [Pengzhenrongella sicca]QTE29435.1 WYL domain-containing protein [Pengzhenrongella sicca]